jgi:hypothetical protein
MRGNLEEILSREFSESFPGVEEGYDGLFDSET